MRRLVRHVDREARDEAGGQQSGQQEHAPGHLRREPQQRRRGGDQEAADPDRDPDPQRLLRTAVQRTRDRGGDGGDERGDAEHRRQPGRVRVPGDRERRGAGEDRCDDDPVRGEAAHRQYPGRPRPRRAGRRRPRAGSRGGAGREPAGQDRRRRGDTEPEDGQRTRRRLLPPRGRRSRATSGPGRWGSVVATSRSPLPTPASASGTSGDSGLPSRSSSSGTAPRPDCSAYSRATSEAEAPEGTTQVEDADRSVDAEGEAVTRPRDTGHVDSPDRTAGARRPRGAG